MKIIYLHQYFLTPDMAGGTRSYEMARRLVRAGHEVHMITSDRRTDEAGRGWRQTIESGVTVHWVKVRYENEMGFTRRLLAFAHFAVAAGWRASRLDGDVIFATSTPLTIAIPALFASLVKRIPFVFEVRDMWPDVPIAIGAIKNPAMVEIARRLEIITYKRAAHVVALAPGMRDDIVAKGISGEKVSVIPNGCDLDLFAPTSSDRSPRDQFAWLAHRKLVLYAGTIGKVNGVDYLARLARRVSQMDPEIRFVIIGGGREREAVRALAEREGVLDANLFMIAPLPKRELVPWLQAADLIVALITGPPVVWKDAVQNKFFDALAAGKPIATNFYGWQSRVAEDADVGLTLHATDMDVAAGQLLGALGNNEWLDAVPARARKLAEGRFNRDRLAGDLERILSEVVHRHR